MILSLDLLLQAALTVIGALITVVFYQMRDDLREMRGEFRQEVKRLTDSVDKLNMNVAVIVERVDHHEGRINRLESKGS